MDITGTAPRTEAENREAETSAKQVNVGDLERYASLIAGGALTLNCLFRPTLASMAIGYAGAYLVYRGLTGHCPIYRGLGVNTARRQGPKPVSDRGFKVERSIVVNRPAPEIYRFWRDFQNLPRFMSHLDSVHVDLGGQSHWAARGPLDAKVEWDARIINERENELIAWESLPGSEVDHAGSVQFRPAEGGATEIKVNLKYNPPAGSAGRVVAWIFGKDPERQIGEDLRHFKKILESGEVSTGSGAGPGGV